MGFQVFEVVRLLIDAEIASRLGVFGSGRDIYGKPFQGWLMSNGEKIVAKMNSFVEIWLEGRDAQDNRHTQHVWRWQCRRDATGELRARYYCTSSIHGKHPKSHEFSERSLAAHKDPPAKENCQDKKEIKKIDCTRNRTVDRLCSHEDMLLYLSDHFANVHFEPLTTGVITNYTMQSWRKVVLKNIYTN